MGKNILVLTGSPRVSGNSDLLADAFIKGAEQAGHDVINCAVGRKNIMGCTGCDTCYSKGMPCSFDDDFNDIAPLFEKAEMIVFVTPLCWFTFSTQLKAAIDKIRSFYIGKKELKIKESMLMVCGATRDDTHYEGIISSYKSITRYLNWTDRGHLIVPGVLKKGDILSTDYLALAERMGHNI